MRSVVVASGKGGTGKTTMTAIFAHLASRTMRVVVADADVEASNLPIALGAASAQCIGFPGLPTAFIDASSCTECGACARACRFDAVVRADSGSYSVDTLSCEGCGRCAAKCPSGAIIMQPASAGEACHASSTVGPIAYGQLAPGEDLSGKLVTEVRRLGADLAREHEAELLLVDGPPGTGCPLIAAVASCDLLVAVAEPSVSGVHDLDRLAQIAAQLDLPVRVVLNKADLSEEGAVAVRALCESKGIPLVAEVPFDPALAAVLSDLATADAELPATSAGVQAVIAAWDELSAVHPPEAN